MYSIEFVIFTFIYEIKMINEYTNIKIDDILTNYDNLTNINLKITKFSKKKKK